MNAEKILQSDVLDILFENRNKDYGAYNLRKNYNRRLFQSIGFTCLIAVLLAMLQSMKPPKSVFNPANTPDSTILIDLPKERHIDEPKQQQRKPETAVVNDAPITVVPDRDVRDTIPSQQTLADNTLGTSNKPGDTNTGIEVDPGPPSAGGDGVDINEKPVEPAFDDVNPRDYAQVMPEFPGGMIALQKFMLKHLQQPDNIEPGQKVVVRAKFVVDKEGNITEIDIIQSGRKDLDKEVIRVVKKMPKWKPGLQSGRPVAVYFNLPVSFVNNEE